MSNDELVFLVVVAGRLFIPLLIFRFPLPAILACLVLDAADQTIFQNNTNLNLDGYQSYDKALDVFYLAMAYLSTLRNWVSPFAANTAMFLWYYRLVGVVIFELTQERAVLIIFPNTFEYFFIVYETIRLAWNPARLTNRMVIGLAAFIWIFIKLPQEWWLHIAKLDFTDFMKEDVFGVSVDTSWGDAISENLWFVGLLIVLVVVVVVGVRYALAKAPPPDWKFSFDVDSHLGPPPTGYVRPERLLSWGLLEKVVLTALVSVIFALIVPDVDGTFLRVSFAVSVIVIANAALHRWLSVRGWEWDSVMRNFFFTLVLNLGITLGYIWLLRRSDDPIDEAGTLFFVLLLTLIITLFDRYRHTRDARLAPSWPPATPTI